MALLEDQKTRITRGPDGMLYPAAQAEREAALAAAPAVRYELGHDPADNMLRMLPKEVPFGAYPGPRLATHSAPGTMALGTAQAPPPPPRAPLPGPLDQAADEVAKKLVFSYNRTAPAGGIVANGSQSDWSPGSPNALATTGSVDRYGRDYDAQVAHANTVNDATMRGLAALSPREAAEAGIMAKQQALAGSGRRGKPDKDFNPVTMANAAAGVAGAQSRIKALDGAFADKRALATEASKSESERYKADQELAGRKAIADSGIESTRMTVEGSTKNKKAELELAEKTAKNQRRSDLIKVYETNVKALSSPDSVLMAPEQRLALEQETRAIRASLSDELGTGKGGAGAEEPGAPMKGARKAPDGNWYILKDGKYNKVG